MAVTETLQSQRATIESVHIRGFRSVADVNLTNLGHSVVLIGANGSGKSNLIRFFEMVSCMFQAGRLDEFVEWHGGADDQLFGGKSTTTAIEAEIRLRTSTGRNDYSFALAYAHPDRFDFVREAIRFNKDRSEATAPWQRLENRHQEAAILVQANNPDAQSDNSTTASIIVDLLKSCTVFDLHDTSNTSAFKKEWEIDGNSRMLRSDGGNLAAVLYRLEREDLRRYEWICSQINRVLPTFDGFTISERKGRVQLAWKAIGHTKTIGADLTSDGSLRFFAMATLLNLPAEMLPKVLLIDQPELGLHPVAISLVGGMIKSLSTERQVIVATQSPLLVDEFRIDEIIVLNLQNGRTEAQAFDPNAYQAWLTEYTTGELWQKNLLGGLP